MCVCLCRCVGVYVRSCICAYHNSEIIIYIYKSKKLFNLNITFLNVNIVIYSDCKGII